MESALIELKAELLKKKEQANDEAKKRKDVLAKNKLCGKIKSKEKNQAYVQEEEENVFEKSKEMLLKKAALYEQMNSGTETLDNDELNEKFLVNFQKKIEDSVLENKQMRDLEENKDEDWVEFVDELGRTRKCLREDVDLMKKRDQGNMEGPKETSCIPDLEEHRAKIHEKWTKIEEETKGKRNIHYNDVLFDEVREHGVGFMPFSRIDSERAEQMEMLNKLRKETIEAESASKAKRKIKNRQMAERLAKVRQRKRMKLGLPIKEIIEDPESDSSSEEEQVEVSRIPLPVAELKASNVPLNIREWDVGKKTEEGVLLTQEQWVESQRIKRKNEFAPPQNYGDSTENSRSLKNSQTPSPDNHIGTSNISENIRIIRNSNFAPPPTNDYYGKYFKK